MAAHFFRTCRGTRTRRRAQHAITRATLDVTARSNERLRGGLGGWRHCHMRRLVAVAACAVACEPPPAPPRHDHHKYTDPPEVLYTFDAFDPSRYVALRAESKTCLFDGFRLCAS